MEREQYRVMWERERTHWWYVGMRRAALALLRANVPVGQSLQVLDAGCGTGGTTAYLKEWGTVFGVDRAWEAVEPAAQNGLGGHIVRGGIEGLPFADGSFDVVTSFDVLYHLGVANDVSALCEMRRVLVPGGALLIRVPAHDWLRGHHDRLVHTRHRYSRAELARKLRTAGFRVERVSWASSLLFPLAVAKRLAEQYLGSSVLQNAAGEPDLWQPPAPLNALLTAIVGLEALALPRVASLPFGLSAIALARAA